MIGDRPPPINGGDESEKSRRVHHNSSARLQIKGKPSECHLFRDDLPDSRASRVQEQSIFSLPSPPPLLSFGWRKAPRKGHCLARDSVGSWRKMNSLELRFLSPTQTDARAHWLKMALSRLHEVLAATATSARWLEGANHLIERPALSLALCVRTLKIASAATVSTTAIYRWSLVAGASRSLRSDLSVDHLSWPGSSLWRRRRLAAPHNRVVVKQTGARAPVARFAVAYGRNWRLPTMSDIISWQRSRALRAICCAQASDDDNDADADDIISQSSPLDNWLRLRLPLLGS